MGSHLRIAIALAALRHKPSDQSIQAYILDLQAAFPIVCSCQPCQSGSAFSEPWRERALALESELEVLRTQHEQEKIELLALRKAAQATTRPCRPAPTDDGRETDSTSTPSVARPGKKAKAKKTKPPPPPPPVPAPAPEPEPAPGRKSMLGAILQGDFADIAAAGPSARLHAADALLGLLAADPMAVSADLVGSTTRRALEAVGGVFGCVVARCGSAGTGAGAGTGVGSQTGPATPTAWDPASTLETLGNVVRSLVSTVLPALAAQRAAALRCAKHSRARVGAASTAASAAEVATDDILGCIYESVLAPAVRAFAPLSEGYLAACFGADDSTSLGETTNANAPPAVPDLRPDVFALLEGILGALDDVLSGNQLPSSSPAGPAPVAVPAPIPGANTLKTLLALECVRSLARLYLPHEQHALDSPAQAYSRAPSTSALTSVYPSGARAAQHAAVPSLGRGPPRSVRNLGEIERERGAPSGPAGGRGPVRDSDSVRAGAASASGGKAKRGDADGGGVGDKGEGERIARLARKDAVWWLCAVLGRLLPTLTSPSSSECEPAEGDEAGLVPSGSAGCADVAHEAVYAALANLLRRTRPHPHTGPAHRGCSSPLPPPPPSPLPLPPPSSSSSPRRHSPRASNHEEPAPAPSADPDAAGAGSGLEGPGRAGGWQKSKPGLEKAGTHGQGDRRAGRMDRGMGEVERGMLLAVLERAWLGV